MERFTRIASLWITLLVATAAAGFAQEATGPHVTTEDGEAIEFDAVDPASRTADMFAVYTPDFGESTGTNEFGGEAVVEPTGEDEEYEVVHVCDFFSSEEGDCDSTGDNEIPQDGFVISGSPDEGRDLIEEEFEEGDIITLDIPDLQEATRSLDVINPTAENNPEGVEDEENNECFPGCRGAEQLVMYKPDSGESTGTNEFGDELLVVDDRVVQRGGFDTPIPEDGYVLSGHSSSGEWLVSNSIVGASVDVDESEMEVTLTVDEQAYLAAADQAIERAGRALDSNDGDVRDDLEEAEDLLSDAEESREAARDALEEDDPTSLISHAEQATEHAEQAWIHTRRSRSPEVRAIWVRPEDDWDSPDAIQRQVERIAEAGINTIYLETFFQGYTIYESDVAAEAGIEAQRPAFAEEDLDALAEWRDAADDHGIETHAWVHTFFVANPAVSEGNGPVLEANPEWAAIPRETALDDDSDDIGAPAENGYRFVDPAHEEVQDHLLALFEEMVVEYELDGLQLDYIRYPISRPVEHGFSYGATAEAFEEEQGIDPLEINEDDSQWEDWIEFRESVITGFVERVDSRLESVAPDAELSAAVFPDLEGDAARRKFQRWDRFASRNLVDALAGMSFGTAAQANLDDTQTMLDATEGTDVAVYTGNYAPLNGSEPVLMLEQLEAIREAGADGLGLFSYSQITDSQLQALINGVFHENAPVK